MRITYITNFNIFDPTSPSQQIRATLWLIADYLPVSCLAIFRLARNGLQWWSWPRKVGWCHQRVRLPRTALKRVAVLKLIVDNCRNDAKSRIAGNWLQSGTAHSFLKGNLSHSETVLSSEEQTHPSSCYKFWHALAWHALDHHDFRALNHSILSLWWRRFCCLKQGKAGHKVNCFWASNLQIVKLNKWRPPSEVDSTPSIVCLYLLIKTFALMLETVHAVVRKSANAVAARHVHHWGHHLLRLGCHQAMCLRMSYPQVAQVQGDHPKGFRVSWLGHCAHLAHLRTGEADILWLRGASSTLWQFIHRGHTLRHKRPMHQQKPFAAKLVIKVDENYAKKNIDIFQHSIIWNPSKEAIYKIIWNIYVNIGRDRKRYRSSLVARTISGIGPRPGARSRSHGLRGYCNSVWNIRWISSIFVWICGVCTITIIIFMIYIDIRFKLIVKQSPKNIV